MKIKSCPFCGGTPKLEVIKERGLVRFNETNIRVICTKCHCSTPRFNYNKGHEKSGKYQAVRCWNNRSEKKAAYYILRKYVEAKETLQDGLNKGLDTRSYHMLFTDGRQGMCKVILRDYFGLVVGYDKERDIYYAENSEYRIEVPRSCSEKE